MGKGNIFVTGGLGYIGALEGWAWMGKTMRAQAPQRARNGATPRDGRAPPKQTGCQALHGRGGEGVQPH